MLILLFYLFWGILFRSIGTIYLYHMDKVAFSILYPDKKTLLLRFSAGVFSWPYDATKGIITLVNMDLWK